mmetsp:Transcript_20904/g.29211  ORF Transcript_20904/g.29211 Transcript_20904/m.29211 type:complete len:93 (-) Transcript_20904:341-619(-)
METGEALFYDLSVLYNRAVKFVFSLSSKQSRRFLRVQYDKQDIATIPGPGKGVSIYEQVFTEVVNLSPGMHEVRVLADAGPIHFDYFEIRGL